MREQLPDKIIVRKTRLKMSWTFTKVGKMSDNHFHRNKSNQDVLKEFMEFPMQ